jgi:hypothetical protein
MHYPKIFTRELMEKLENCEVPLKKAQIYRYLDCLKLYNLIIGNIWHKSEIGIGYRYKITKKGLYVLQILSENFEI